MDLFYQWHLFWRPTLCQRGLDWDATFFFKLLCVLLPGSLSIFFLPISLCLSSLHFSSSESHLQGLGRWVGLSHLASVEWNVCVCVFIHLCGGLIFMLCQLWRAYLIYDIFTVKEGNRYLERERQRETERKRDIINNHDNKLNPRVLNE